MAHGHGHQCCAHSQNQRIQSGCRLDYAAGAERMTTSSGMVLNGFIDTHKLCCWNFAQPTPVVSRVVFDASVAPTPDKTVVADCDEELLMYVPFTEFVRIRGIAIIGGGSGTGPSHVNLYANQPEMRGFDTVQRLQPHEKLELVDTDNDSELIYLLDAGKFMSVGNLTILVAHSFSGEETHLRKILLFGESTRLPTWRPVVANVVYELRGNPADHPQDDDDGRKKFDPLLK
jgi:hypothetical protein